MQCSDVDDAPVVGPPDSELSTWGGGQGSKVLGVPISPEKTQIEVPDASIGGLDTLSPLLVRSRTFMTELAKSRLSVKI